ncbi:MAG: PadR family transcriptional regulator [Sedimentisphaeraceae bacterium JB056]|jgi:DNA-binding PadR family transcriptional regulator
MKFERELMKGVAPMIVLEVLSRGKMYGYELSTAIEKRSGGIFTLGKGTLYPLLYNLEAKGLVASEWEEEQGSRKRKFYSITSKGSKRLAAQKDQWAGLREGLELIFGGGSVALG